MTACTYTVAFKSQCSSPCHTDLACKLQPLICCTSAASVCTHSFLPWLLLYSTARDLLSLSAHSLGSFSSFCTFRPQTSAPLPWPTKKLQLLSNAILLCCCLLHVSPQKASVELAACKRSQNKDHCYTPTLLVYLQPGTVATSAKQQDRAILLYRSYQESPTVTNRTPVTIVDSPVPDILRGALPQQSLWPVEHY